MCTVYCEGLGSTHDAPNNITIRKFGKVKQFALLSQTQKHSLNVFEVADKNLYTVFRKIT